jgi:hypothetical protein
MAAFTILLGLQLEKEAFADPYMTWGFHCSDCEVGCLLGHPGVGGSTDLWNVGKLIPVCMVLQPRRQPSFVDPCLYERYILFCCV